MFNSLFRISSLDDPEKTSNTETSSKQKKDEIVELEREDKLFTYDVFERPPIPMTVLFALQVNYYGTVQKAREKQLIRRDFLLFSLNIYYKVHEKAMIRNRYNRIPHPVTDTKSERDNTFEMA